MEAMTVPGTLEALGDIRAYVTNAAGLAELDDKRTYRLALAVDEIATNIVTHGYQESNTSGNIGVSASVEDGSLFIILSDTAPPYDPLQRPEPDDLDAPLAERQMGGLGVFLARQNTDEYRYEYADEQNRNIFVVYLQKTEESS